MSDKEFAYTAKLTKQKVEKRAIEDAIKLLLDNGNLYFEDCYGKVSPITYCEIDKLGDIVFKE